MPLWKQYICLSYGISSNWYREFNENIARTGQGNKFSGKLCRDMSCLIIKIIEKKNLEIMINHLLWIKKNKLYQSHILMIQI